MIDKKKEGSSAFFRVVTEVLIYEPSGLKNGVWEPTPVKSHGELNRIPKPPLTIVEDETEHEEPSGVIRALQHNSETQAERIRLIESRIETLSKVAWDASNSQNSGRIAAIERRLSDLEKEFNGKLQGLYDRICDVQAKCITLESRVRDLENKKVSIRKRIFGGGK